VKEHNTDSKTAVYAFDGYGYTEANENSTDAQE
jgi:hypothetical protein